MEIYRTHSLETFYQLYKMIKNLIIALLFAPHPKKHNLGNHIIMKYEDTSEGPPGITDKRYNFGKNKWMNDRLFELQSARISIIDKEEIAKDVLDLLDIDDITRMGFNLMAGGLTGDWDFTHFDHQS